LTGIDTRNDWRRSSLATVDRCARFFSIIGNPPIWATVYFAILVAFFPQYAGMTIGVWSILILLPTLVLLYGMRRGVWASIDLTDLHQRRTYMPWTILGAVAASIITLVGRYPFALRLSVLGISLWLVFSTLIGFWWKISLHVGGATGLMWLSLIVLGLPALILV